MAVQPPLRAGLFGAGYIVERHIPAWQASPDAELVAVCDLNRARAEERAKQYGIPAVYDSVEAMLDAENLDCVDIATRPESHKALASLAASRGVNVLCQKPLASTLAEGREIAEVCAKAGVRLMVLEMWRQAEAMQLPFPDEPSTRSCASSGPCSSPTRPAGCSCCAGATTWGKACRITWYARSKRRATSKCS